MLPHLRDRPLTMRRCPDGVDGESFYEKNAPRGTPDWVRTVAVPRSEKGGGTIDYVVLDEPAGLVWAANLAALELHVPDVAVAAEGRVRPGRPDGLRPRPRRAVRPGRLLPGRAVAAGRPGRRWPGRLPEDQRGQGAAALRPAPPRPAGGPTSGTTPTTWPGGSRPTIPRHVVSNMRRDLRHGKVLIDWSQNHGAKTTVAPYSLRARPHPTVSTPVTWDEVAAGVESGPAGASWSSRRPTSSSGWTSSVTSSSPSSEAGERRRRRAPVRKLGASWDRPEKYL